MRRIEEIDVDWFSGQAQTYGALPDSMGQSTRNHLEHCKLSKEQVSDPKVVEQHQNDVDEAECSDEGPNSNFSISDL